VPTKDPVFDLRATTKVKRDDSITVRADTDVTLTGPLPANVDTVFVTTATSSSRYPSHRCPARQAAPCAPDTGVSFPAAPLRDWKFDLAIKTRPNDSSSFAA
jgi:hypothetical protein